MNLPEEPKHKTIPIKVGKHWADIDVGILPTVRWLNSLPGVRTLYSCEGNDEAHAFIPYTLFTCKSLKSLEYISQKMEEFHTWCDGNRRVLMELGVKLELDSRMGFPRYDLRFSHSYVVSVFRNF